MRTIIILHKSSIAVVEIYNAMCHKIFLIVEMYLFGWNSYIKHVNVNTDETSSNPETDSGKGKKGGKKNLPSGQSVCACPLKQIEIFLILTLFEIFRCSCPRSMADFFEEGSF